MGNTGEMDRRIGINAWRFPLSLADVEKGAIEYALAFARGNKSLAADLLGIQRHRLYRKILKHGIASGIRKR